MSFAQQVKTEICENRLFRQRLARAQAYGLLLFGNRMDAGEISIHTEHRVAARLFADVVSDLAGLSGSITLRELPRTKQRSIYVGTVDSAEDRHAVLSFFSCGEGAWPLVPAWMTPNDLPGFLSGIFLACGTITDPEKDYRAEFCVRRPEQAAPLAALLEEAVGAVKQTTRRKDRLLYYNESEHIEDLLTYVGAAKSALAMMEVKIVKDVRNRVNRATNCETANLSKTVDAAVEQVEDIRFIEQSGGLDQLNDELRGLARLRLEHTELSLRELAQTLGISRSGVNHRLARIRAVAADLRKS